MSMSGNYIFVEQGSKAYEVASNFTNYLELGTPGADPDYYFEAQIDNDEFIIDAVLREPSSPTPLRIVKSFPEGGPWKKDMLTNGWRIVDPNGELILGLEVNGNICHIKGKVKSRDGTLVAEDSNNNFLIYKGPAVLGRSGTSRGIVIG